MTQSTSSAAAATTGVSRSNTATVYDQYGDTMAGIVVTFTSASELPGGLHCTAIAVSVCTTILAHGLTAGDLLDYADDGSFTCAVSCGAAGVQAPVAGVVFCVGTVLTTTTFNLQDDDCSTAVNASAGAASVAATPLQLTRRSFAHSSNTRTTGSAGTATFSWVDTEGTSGEDTVTATSSAADTATAEF
jgi:hypothetical protein